MASHTAKKWQIKFFYSFDRFFVLKILRKKITAARNGTFVHESGMS